MQPKTWVVFFKKNPSFFPFFLFFLFFGWLAGCFVAVSFTASPQGIAFPCRICGRDTVGKMPSCTSSCSIARGTDLAVFRPAFLCGPLTSRKGESQGLGGRGGRISAFHHCRQTAHTIETNKQCRKSSLKSQS